MKGKGRIRDWKGKGKEEVGRVRGKRRKGWEGGMEEGEGREGAGMGTRRKSSRPRLDRDTHLPRRDVKISRRDETFVTLET